MWNSTMSPSWIPAASMTSDGMENVRPLLTRLMNGNVSGKRETPCRLRVPRLDYHFWI